MKSLSRYDRRALEKIRAWKHPEVGRVGRVFRALNRPLEQLGDATLSAPVLGWILRKVIEGLVSLANEVAQYTVRPETIRRKFRKRGHRRIRSVDDVADLELRDVDKVVGWLKTKYVAMATAEGAGAGVGGAMTIPPDVVALVTLNLRAIGEYATYYGFEVETQEERLFAMQVNPTCLVTRSTTWNVPFGSIQ